MTKFIVKAGLDDVYFVETFNTEADAQQCAKNWLRRGMPDVRINDDEILIKAGDDPPR